MKQFYVSPEEVYLIGFTHTLLCDTDIFCLIYLN